MAIQNFLFASLLIFSSIESNHGATEVSLFTNLENSLEVTAKPIRDGVGIKIFCFGMLRVRDRHFVFRFRCSRPALVSGVAFVHPMSVWLCIWEVMASIAFASLALFPGIGVLVNAISPALFDRCFKFFSSPSTLDLIL